MKQGKQGEFSFDSYNDDNEVNSCIHTKVQNDEEIKLIIFDTETTGLDEEDRIIQVGAIIEGLEESKDFIVHNEWCIPLDDENKRIKIKIEAMATHGIRENHIDIKGKESFWKTDFIKDLNLLNSEENYLIAHNLDFDLKMLQKEGFVNKMKLIDTLQCAKHLYEIGDEINDHKVPNHKLQTFRYMMFSEEEEDYEAKKYGVEIKAHDAIGDVVILKMFLKKLKDKIMKKFQINDSIEIMNKMVELTQLPVEVKFINFGKHSGKTVSEINQIDPGWLQWFYNVQLEQKEKNDPKFNRDLFFTLDKVLNEN